MSSEFDNADAWNPGLLSDIPTALWPQVTLFRPEHTNVSYSEALELSDLTGLNVLDLVSLRPERLLVHSLLVRVTADLSVPDGPNYEDLGVNLRSMVEQLRTAHMQAALPRMTKAIKVERQKAFEYVSKQLSDRFKDKPLKLFEQVKKPSVLHRLFKRTKTVEISPVVEAAPEIAALNIWKSKLEHEVDPSRIQCLKALVKTVAVIAGHRGRMLPDHSLISRIVVNQVCNRRGADVVDQYVNDIWSAAIGAEGYRLLPAQNKPFIMNVKGASASGKSTIRPQQRQLAEKLGIPWSDFALISPDYWRKYLFDYSSLGKQHKYGAMLTGWELELIDKKLDVYIAEKASKGSISHLLIDRFRFDSFTIDVNKTTDSTLLSRFGDQVFLYFMVTHPAETVSRAWLRGKTTGRYKAVDDLLYHNVEAFTGMPALFLSWVNSHNKRVHFEFLDNDVPKGSLPKTAAFGWNKTLVILDVNLLLNIDRYRKINIAAKQPEELFESCDLNPESNTRFVRQCADTVGKIIFADQETAVEYAHVQQGELIWWDFSYIDQHQDKFNIIATLSALGYKHAVAHHPAKTHLNQIDRDAERRVTVGQWYTVQN